MTKWYNVVCVAACGGLAALMRHNAILLIGPLMLRIAAVYWKKVKYYGLAAGVLTIVIMGGIKGPVYRLLSVQPHAQVSARCWDCL